MDNEIALLGISPQQYRQLYQILSFTLDTNIAPSLAGNAIFLLQPICFPQAIFFGSPSPPLTVENSIKKLTKRRS
jgi:hypothetical protein